VREGYIRAMHHQRSQALFARASSFFPGGVNSPVRAYGSVGMDPVCLARGAGPHVFDVDGNRYIDFVCSYGPLILGHADPRVIEAIGAAAVDGTTFGATTEREVALAERVQAAMPHIERMRFVSSGTEATMSALRLARGATKRERVIKFSGGYHGHADAFLASDSGSGVATLGIAGSAGVTQGAIADTITVAYNDLPAVQQVMQEMGPSVAAIIVEPIACNMGMVQPQAGFLAGLRALCDAHGACLIFDEVITGFRVAHGGATALLGVTPDLVTLGKIIGGGLPVGAYGGRAELMNHVAPLGPVYQAGTLSGNPLAMAAGIATLDAIGAPGFFAELEGRAAHFAARMQAGLDRLGRPMQLIRQGSLFFLFARAGEAGPPGNYADIKAGDPALYSRMFVGALEHGVALAPSAFEVGFISAAHTRDILDEAADTLIAALEASLTR
jgi:glutamate-1-semialdehyde 2,1-aminomutase